jgi:hypothetical protein
LFSDGLDEEEAGDEKNPMPFENARLCNRLSDNLAVAAPQS